MLSLEKKDIPWQLVQQLFSIVDNTSIFPREVSEIICAYACKESLFAVGGWRLKTMERFDLAKNVWEEMPSMKSTRTGLGVVAAGNYLFAVGGYDDNDNEVATMEKFDMKNNIWEEMPSMKSKRAELEVVAIGNYLYAIGGCDGAFLNSFLKTIERFDLAKNVWEEMPSMLCKRRLCAAVAFCPY